MAEGQVPEDRLNSWKEIAAYLNRTVRTVHRWERAAALPVYRHGSPRGSVYAYRSELDEWLRKAPAGGGKQELQMDARSWRRGWISGAGVLLLIAGGLWRWTPAMKPPALKLRPLTTYPGAENFPSLSPHADLVAFSWNGPNQDNYDIYVQPVEGGSPHRLTTDPSADYSPAFSPDGRRIAFRRGFDVYVMPISGAGQRKLATGLVRQFTQTGFGKLSWSTDGKWVAFADRDREDTPSGIFQVSVDTGERRRLTVPPAGLSPLWGDLQPAFSFDGRYLAFVRGASQAFTAIFVLPLEPAGHPAGEPRRVTRDGANARGLDWTADSQAIVYCSSDGLMRVPANRQEDPEALVNGVRGYGPSVARLGRRAVYAEYVLDTNIWRISASGKEPPVRLIASTRDDHAPVYSPDGTKIAFTSTRSGNQELWTCDSDGAHPLQLTRFGGPIVGSARWSPDGTRIAFHASPGGLSGVFVVPASGGTPVRLTADATSESSPAWSPDGRWIYFGSLRTGAWQIWRRPTGGGDARQITHHGGTLAIPSPDGTKIYYARENERGIWRVPVDGGEEIRALEEGMTNDWAVSATGIYLLRRESNQLSFYPFGAAQPSRTVHLPDGTRFGLPSSRQIAVSPDEQWILYTRTDRVESDLVLLENFR